MFNKLNKKGLAEIVQVLMITLLSIVAIATISSYILGLSNGLESKLSPVVDCLTMQSKIQNACVNSEGKIEVLVNSAEEKVNLKLAVKNNIFECSTNQDTCSTCKLSEGSKEIFLNPLSQINSGDKLNYQINGCQGQEKTIIACVEP